MLLKIKGINIFVCVTYLDDLVELYKQFINYIRRILNFVRFLNSTPACSKV